MKRRARESQEKREKTVEVACFLSAIIQKDDQQPFRPNPNGVRNRTIKLRRLLIGADVAPSCYSLTYT